MKKKHLLQKEANLQHAAKNGEDGSEDDKT